MNSQAWAILTEDEKTAISIKYGMDKSTWQVGEIMGKSHYKYLEIQYRGEHFLKLFTERLKLFDELIPNEVIGDRTVVSYLRICIEKRLKPKLVLEQLKETKKIIRSEFNGKIEKVLKDWEKSDSPYDKMGLELVKEFDRWNNFRILPKSCQEPSAYKRRIKNIYKKHIKVISTINILSINKILKLYQTKRRPYHLLPLIVQGEPNIFKVKINQQSIKIFNGIGLYVFEETDIKSVEVYISSIHGYLNKSQRECSDGLEFWPGYREIIKIAINHDEIQRITPTRKYLQLALQKFKFI